MEREALAPGSVDRGFDARGITLTMLKLGSNAYQALTQLGVGLPQSLQLLFVAALLFLHLRDGFAKALGRLYLLICGFGQRG